MHLYKNLELMCDEFVYLDEYVDVYEDDANYFWVAHEFLTFGNNAGWLPKNQLAGLDEKNISIFDCRCRISPNIVGKFRKSNLKPYISCYSAHRHIHTGEIYVQLKDFENAGSWAKVIEFEPLKEFEKYGIFLIKKLEILKYDQIKQMIYTHNYGK